MSGLILPGRQVFLVDTHVNLDPSADQLAEITELAAEQLRAFGLVPKAALLSHSNFGISDAPSALKMRAALALLQRRLPDLEVDGEMHGDCALDEGVRKAVLATGRLSGGANLLVCPSLDSANIAYNLLKTAAGNNVAIGPILLGCAAPAHILTSRRRCGDRQHVGALRGGGEPWGSPRLEHQALNAGERLAARVNDGVGGERERAESPCPGAETWARDVAFDPDAEVFVRHVAIQAHGELTA